MVKPVFVYVEVVLLINVVTRVYGPPVVVDLYILCWVTSVDVDGVQVRLILPPWSAEVSDAARADGAKGASLRGVAEASLLLADYSVPSQALTT